MLNKLNFVILAAFILIESSLSFCAQDKVASKVIAYYFHGKFRCFTCTNMEKYSREAIETNFKDALQSGKIEFKPVDVEEKDNEHFAKDYQLYTKSLIISLVKDGKEVKSKNLDKIWEYAGNKQKFVDYVTFEINAFTKDWQ